jgi:hypothetical protein
MKAYPKKGGVFFSEKYSTGWKSINVKNLCETELLTTVVMKSSIRLDIMLCNALKVNQHFGGVCRLHLQG